MPEITPYRLTPEHHAGQDMHIRILQAQMENQDRPNSPVVWSGPETVTPDDEYKYATRQAIGTKSFDTFWMEQSLTSMPGSIAGWAVDQAMNGARQEGFEGNDYIRSKFPNLNDGSPMSQSVVAAINQGWFDGAFNPRSAEYRLKQAMTFTHEMREAHAGFMGTGSFGAIGDVTTSVLAQAGGDPTILLPGMALVKFGVQGAKAAAMGVGKRTMIGAGVGGGLNIAHLKSAQGFNPGLNVKGAEDEAIAVFMGLAMGAGLPLLGAASKGKFNYAANTWSNAKVGINARRLRKSWQGTEEGLQKAIDDLKPTTAAGAADHLDMPKVAGTMRGALKETEADLDILLSETVPPSAGNLTVSPLKPKGSKHAINQKIAKLRAKAKREKWTLNEIEHPQQGRMDVFDAMAGIIDNPNLGGSASRSSLHIGPMGRLLGKVTGSYAKAQRWINPGQRLAHNTHTAVQDMYRLLSGSAADLSEASARNWRTNIRGTTAEGFTESLRDAASDTQARMGSIYNQARRDSRAGGGINYDGGVHRLGVGGQATWDNMVANYLRRRHDQRRGYTGVTVPDDVHSSIKAAADELDKYYKMMGEERVRSGLGQEDGSSPLTSSGRNSYAPVIYNLDEIRSNPVGFVRDLSEAMREGNRLRGGKFLAEDDVPVDAGVALEMNTAAHGKNLFHAHDEMAPTRPQSGMTRAEIDDVPAATQTRIASAMERNEADGPVLLDVHRDNKWNADTDTVIGTPAAGAKHGPHPDIKSGADDMTVVAWGPVREVVVNGERRTAQYVLHETDAVNAGTPRRVGGKGVVKTITDNPDDAVLFRDGPTAHAGPAWVTHTGEVVNGRARTLGKQGAYKGKEGDSIAVPAIVFWDDLVGDMPSGVNKPDVSLMLVGEVDAAAVRKSVGRQPSGAEPTPGTVQLNTLFNTNEFKPGNFLKGVKAGDLSPELRVLYDNAMREHFRQSARGVRDKILNPTEGHGVVDGLGLKPHLRQRAVNVPHSMIEKYLAKEAEATMSRYSHQVSGEIGIRRALLDNQEQMAPYAKMLGRPITKPQDIVDVIDHHFNTMKQAADLVGDQKLATHVLVTHNKIKRDLYQPMEMMRGNNMGRAAGDHAGGLAWFGRNIQRYNFVTKLGSVGWAQLNDIAPQTFMMATNPRNMRMIPAALNWTKNFARKDLELLGLFTDRMGRTRAIGDLDDMSSPQFGFGSGATRTFTAKIEEAAIKGADFSGHVSGMNWITSSMKRLGAMQTLQKMGDLTKKMVRVDDLMKSGMPQAQAMAKMRLTQFWATKMNDMGFDIKAARRYHRLTYSRGLTRKGKDIRSTMSYEKYMRNGKDLFLPNFDEWGTHIPGNRKLLDTLNGRMRDEVNRHLVVTPGYFDKPLMNQKMIGRLANQFQTFMSAFLGQRLVPMAQMPAHMQLWYYGNYMMLGAITDGITNHLSGRRSLSDSGQMWLDNPGGMAYKAAAYSGLTGPISRPFALMDAIGFGPGTVLKNTLGGGASQAGYYGDEKNAFIQALGPTATAATTGLDVVGDLFTGNVDRNTANRAATMVPFQNQAILRILHKTTGLPVVPEALKPKKKKTHRGLP